MIEINKMYHKKTGEVIMQDVEGNWFMQEYQEYEPMAGIGTEWQPVIVSKIEDPTLGDNSQNPKQ